MAGERVTVTWRGRPVAVLMPLEMEDRFEPLAFGLWRGREDLEDVEQWLAKLRQPRSLQ